MKAITWHLGVALVLGVCLLPIFGTCDERAEQTEQGTGDETEPVASNAPAPPPAALGRLAFRDPTTRERVGSMSAAQSTTLHEALAEILSQDSTGLEEEILPNGTVMLDLQGRFNHATIVTRHPDGTRTVTCTQNLAEARRVLSPESGHDVGHVRRQPADVVTE